ncbi:MAG: serine/threonine protein kinase [Actinomycetota bacterium]|nr:serine/threonine protein kinase [Actinomycetota bacterium]
MDDDDGSGRATADRAARSGPEGYSGLRVVGRGGTATVHRALRTADGTVVALKVFDDGERTSYDRQVRAAQVLADVDGVAATLDHGISPDGRPFLVSTFVDGGSLADHLQRVGALPPGRVAELGRSLTTTLAAAHAAGVLHRDLKPSNVLLDADGAPVLSDFGAAGFVDAATASATMAVTLLYAAPEVLEGASADERSDVYSLGLTLLAAATGRRPFGGTDDPGTTGLASIVNRICAEGVPDDAIDELPAGLAAVLRTSTELDPADRYPDASSFGAALAEVADDPFSIPVGTASRRRGRRGRRRSGVLLGALAAVLAVVVVAGAVVLTRPDEPTVPAGLGEPVTEANGILGPLYEQSYANYVGMLDPGCGDGEHLVELSIHAGPEDFASDVATPWDAVLGEGAGTFMSYMPCDTDIDQARYKLGATGRWFVFVAEFPEDQYERMSGWMRENENSPSPDFTVDDEIRATLTDPDVYAGWAIIDQDAE